MNQQDKKRFIRELIRHTQDAILSKVNQMPEEWDGIEIRHYVAERFMSNSFFTPNEIRLRSHLFKRRLKDYRNEVLVRNL